MNFEGLSRKQKIRATLHRDVRSLCLETCHFLGLEITKPAMELISELVYKKLSVYGTDLEAFAKHAKRSTINSEDVKLLVRRNPSLKAHLNTIIPANANVKEKRRKTIVPVTKQQETSAKPREETEAEAPVIGNSSIESSASICTSKLNAKPEELDEMAVDDTIDLTFD